MWKYKGYKLPEDVPLIIETLLRLFYYEIMIHWKPMPTILAEIRGMGNNISSSPSPAEVMLKLDKLWRACGFWMGLLLHNSRPCLRRSLVMYRWCQKHGVDSKVVIGVDKNDGMLKGHAWLYVNGQVYREEQSLLAKDYTVMLEG